MFMFKIENTDHATLYISASDVVRLVERQYNGGGCVIIFRDGFRVETYKPIDEVHALVNGSLR